MKCRFWVVGNSGRSLRDLINQKVAEDRGRPETIVRYPVRLKRALKAERRRGWGWVHSRYGGRGVVRYRWNAQLRILECWAVTKAGNRPAQIIGEFVETLLGSARGRIKHIHIEAH